MAPVATAIEEQRKTDETALITGSEAIAVACKLADVDVITAYPIRPSATIYSQSISPLATSLATYCMTVS